MSEKTRRNIDAYYADIFDITEMRDDPDSGFLSTRQHILRLQNPTRGGVSGDPNVYIDQFFNNSPYVTHPEEGFVADTRRPSQSVPGASVLELWAGEMRALSEKKMREGLSPLEEELLRAYQDYFASRTGMAEGGEVLAPPPYRNPLFGRRVDRYIPPELRQGIGALLAGADMLNPVSAYREYLKDVREGDVVGGVINTAGFVAPGVASAVASRLARPAMSAVAPYGDDAARVLMEILTPTGAPDIQAAGRNAARGMSRREFLAGLGAAAATPALPVDEMLEGLGRAGVRVKAGNWVDELVGILDRRRELMGEYAKDFSRIRSEVGLGDWANNEGLRRELITNLEKRFEPMFDELESDFFKKISTSNIAQGDLESLSDEVLQDLADTALRSPLAEGSGGPELAERIREVLASRRPQPEVGSMLPDVTSRMVSGGDEFRRGLGSFDFPSPEVSQRTQIAGTLPTYRKALEVFDEVAPEGESLDYGAGLGKSSELGFDTFEPYAREGFEPTYRSASEIPDASYERVTNLNVLNVVDPEARRGIVLDIGRILKPDGVAIITTRGRDVLNAKGRPGPEDMSIVTSTGTYQKGFTRAELVDYLRGTLGEGFEVNPLQLGPAGATVRKLPVRPD